MSGSPPQPPPPPAQPQHPPPLTVAVYAQLRAIAQRQMASERAGHTLQATALVHEAFMRLSQHEKTWGSDGEFYGAAAEAMRRILIEHARKRGAVKRGGGRAGADGEAPAVRVSMDIAGVEGLASAGDPETIMGLDDAILRLEKEEPRAAAVVRLRFYVGLTVDQTAAALGRSRNTVMRDWEYARAWLADALRDET